MFIMKTTTLSIAVQFLVLTATAKPIDIVEAKRDLPISLSGEGCSSWDIAIGTVQTCSPFPAGPQALANNGCGNKGGAIWMNAGWDGGDFTGENSCDKDPSMSTKSFMTSGFCTEFEGNGNEIEVKCDGASATELIVKTQNKKMRYGCSDNFQSARREMGIGYHMSEIQSCCALLETLEG